MFFNIFSPLKNPIKEVLEVVMAKKNSTRSNKKNETLLTYKEKKPIRILLELEENKAAKSNRRSENHYLLTEPCKRSLQIHFCPNV